MMKPKRIVQSGGILSLVGVLLLAVRLFGLVSPIVGSIGMLTYLSGTTALMTYILYRNCFVQIEKVSSWVLGFGGALGTLGICMALPIIFAQLTASTATAMLVVAVLLLILVAYVSSRTHQPPQVVERGRVVGWQAKDVVAHHYLWVIVYIGVWLLGMMSLVGAQATGPILTPWASLPIMYLIAVAIGALLLTILLFSNFKTSLILGIIVAQSILMHAYIPASHVLPAGGDIWRHIGIVEHVLDGNPINPVLFGPTATFETVGPVVLPAVLLQPQQYAYSVQWGAMALWHMVTGADLLGFSIWSMPVLFAVLVPILLFYIGVLLFRSSRHGLVLAALSLVPFSLLSQGSLTLPVTIGVIYLLFGLFLLCIALRYGTHMQWILVMLSAVGMLFVYPLHAILYAWCVVLAVILFALRGDTQQTLRRIVLGVSIILGVSLLPIIELAAGYSYVPDTISIFESVKRIVGEQSGWYIASAIRPHDILSGNIVYNHLPESAFVSFLFTTFRWPLMVFMLGLCFFALYGWGYVLVKEKRTSWQMLAVLDATVWGGYIISWYLLDGERQLVRRLDMVCAITLLLFAWYGLTRAIDSVTHSHAARGKVTMVLLLSALLTWWAGMSAFTLGPDMRTMSADEYAVGTYITNQISREDACVLADTWLLLAVEATSAQAIIGGNFAMDAQYGQPERVRLYDLAMNTPTSTLWGTIGQVYAGDSCMLVLPLVSPTKMQAYIDVYGVPTLVGSFGVWQKELQKSDISTTIEA